MRFPKILPLCALALWIAAPGAAQCPEPALQKWLSGCADRLQDRNARRSPPVEVPIDPWSILQSNSILIEPGPFLAERIVEECSAPAAPCEERERREWLAGCIDEALEFVGKTRGEISKAFPEDGGLGTAENIRYLHPRCPYLKLGVTFDFGRDADGRAEMRPDDRILAVEPYLEPAFMD